MKEKLDQVRKTMKKVKVWTAGHKKKVIPAAVAAASLAVLVGIAANVYPGKTATEVRPQKEASTQAEQKKAPMKASEKEESQEEREEEKNDGGKGLVKQTGTKEKKADTEPEADRKPADRTVQIRKKTAKPQTAATNDTAEADERPAPAADNGTAPAPAPEAVPAAAPAPVQKPVEPAAAPVPVQEPAEPVSEPAHQHSWEPVTVTIHHDAVTHTVHHDAVTQTVHHDAVTHEEPVYEYRTICNTCGADITGHIPDHIGPICQGSYSAQQVQTGMNMITDTEAYDEEVVVTEAWDETIVDQEAYDDVVTTGYRCSECGSVKQ